ncbi:hypothetical protein ERJ75_000598200 [Trypanosoma vivax]|nr:hypothetical protein ERJ75_000598200 [Trypanosoma vivax]
MSSRPAEKKQETDNSPNRRSEQLQGCADTMSREGLRALALDDAGDRRRRVDGRGNRVNSGRTHQTAAANEAWGGCVEEATDRGRAIDRSSTERESKELRTMRV